MNIDKLAKTVAALQDHYTALWHVEPEAALPSSNDSEFEVLIAGQHKQNFDLWHEEDNAREPDVSDADIAQVKRNIDALNQRRNDMITEIDIWLAEHDLSAYQDDSLPWNSETLGSIIDRLSIASLKVFHMHEQTQRDDASQEHIASCQQKLGRLYEQRDDLSIALQTFVDDIAAGAKQNKLYRQFKMYNDPSLNPKIYGKS